MRVMNWSSTPSWGRTELTGQPMAPRCDGAADPDHLFPRGLSRPVSADQPDVHRGLAPRSIAGIARIRSDGWASAQAAPPPVPERRYALREVKTRLHQTSFRDAAVAAYGSRCPISRLPEPRLLDPAHIVTHDA